MRRFIRKAADNVKDILDKFDQGLRNLFKDESGINIKFNYFEESSIFTIGVSITNDIWNSAIEVFKDSINSNINSYAKLKKISIRNFDWDFDVTELYNKVKAYTDSYDFSELKSQGYKISVSDNIDSPDISIYIWRD